MGTTGSTSDRDEPLLLEPREVPLGGPRAILVRRTLPHRRIRTIGAWCFADHFGPEPAGDGAMRVPPHPHMGLQTVTWLVEGDAMHRDSEGSLQLVRPGQLGVMTAGRGISHSEYSQPANDPDARLFGVQLWVALPDAERDRGPRYEFHPELPRFELDNATLTLMVGTYRDTTAPASTFSPIVGAEVLLRAGATHIGDLDPTFEYGVLVISGDLSIDGVSVPAGALLYFDPGQTELTLAAATDTRVLLLGGKPFDEELVMWWNFVGRSNEDIVSAREQWERGDRFGTVARDSNAPLPAPPMPMTELRPRPSRPRDTH